MKNCYDCLYEKENLECVACSQVNGYPNFRPKKMTRLETLKKEVAFIKSLRYISFSIKESAIKYYEHKIECIEKYGAENKEVKND